MNITDENQPPMQSSNYRAAFDGQQSRSGSFRHPRSAAISSAAAKQKAFSARDSFTYKHQYANSMSTMSDSSGNSFAPVKISYSCESEHAHLRTTAEEFDEIIAAAAEGAAFRDDGDSDTNADLTPPPPDCNCRQIFNEKLQTDADLSHPNNISPSKQQHNRLLANKLEELHNRAARGDGDTTCCLCGESFGKFWWRGNRYNCFQCGKRVCHKCCSQVPCCATVNNNDAVSAAAAAPATSTVKADSSATAAAAHHWLCKICFEHREAWKKSSAWFFGSSVLLPQFALVESASKTLRSAVRSAVVELQQRNSSSSSLCGAGAATQSNNNNNNNNNSNNHDNSSFEADNNIVDTNQQQTFLTTRIVGNKIIESLTPAGSPRHRNSRTSSRTHLALQAAHSNCSSVYNSRQNINSLSSSNQQLFQNNNNLSVGRESAADTTPSHLRRTASSRATLSSPRASSAHPPRARSPAVHKSDSIFQVSADSIQQPDQNDSAIAECSYTGTNTTSSILSSGSNSSSGTSAIVQHKKQRTYLNVNLGDEEEPQENRDETKVEANRPTSPRPSGISAYTIADFISPQLPTSDSPAQSSLTRTRSRPAANGNRTPFNRLNSQSFRISSSSKHSSSSSSSTATLTAGASPATPAGFVRNSGFRSKSFRERGPNAVAERRSTAAVAAPVPAQQQTFATPLNRDNISISNVNVAAAPSPAVDTQPRARLNSSSAKNTQISVAPPTQISAGLTAGAPPARSPSPYRSHSPLVGKISNSSQSSASRTASRNTTASTATGGDEVFRASGTFKNESLTYEDDSINDDEFNYDNYRPPPEKQPLSNQVSKNQQYWRDLLNRPLSIEHDDEEEISDEKTLQHDKPGKQLENPATTSGRNSSQSTTASSTSEYSTESVSYEQISSTPPPPPSRVQESAFGKLKSTTKMYLANHRARSLSRSETLGASPATPPSVNSPLSTMGSTLPHSSNSAAQSIMAASWKKRLAIGKRLSNSLRRKRTASASSSNGGHSQLATNSASGTPIRHVMNGNATSILNSAKSSSQDSGNLLADSSNDPSNGKLASDNNNSQALTTGLFGAIEFTLLWIEDECVLHCDILRALGLRAMDRNGLSDPYVKLNLIPGASKSNRMRSKTIKNTLNPEFHERLTYYGITPDDVARKTLQITVMDEDLVGRDDFLGQCMLPLARHIQSRPNELRRFNLLLEPTPYNKQQLARMGVSFDQTTNSNGPSIGSALATTTTMMAAATMPTANSTTTTAAASNATTAAVAANQPPMAAVVDDSRGKVLVSLEYNPATEVLVCGIVRCSCLAAMDTMGLSDPYVKLSLKGLNETRAESLSRKRIKRRTTVKKKTLNPVYNEDFMFPAKQADLPLKSLDLTVWDKDVGKSDDFIGQVLFNTETRGGEARRHWCEMLANPCQRIERWHILNAVRIK